MEGTGSGSASSTRSLLDEIRRGGRGDARRGLVARYRGPLFRWARLRLSDECGPAEVDRLVRSTIDDVIESSSRLSPSDRGAFHWRLRQATADRVTTASREATPSPVESPVGQVGEAGAVGEAGDVGETLELYEAALRQLDTADKELVVARVELGFSRGEMAGLFGESDVEAMEKSTRDAILKLAHLMGKAARGDSRSSLKIT